MGDCGDRSMRPARLLSAVGYARITTKAETIRDLQPMVRRSVVPRLAVIDVGTWVADPESVLDALTATFPSRVVIVRSSARSEDSSEASNAGAFRSITDVSTRVPAQLRSAIDQVIRSYGAAHDGDQVLVQEMVSDVARSGVVMTRLPDSGAPYYVVSFDATSGRTDTVTSGARDGVRTVLVFRGASLRVDLRAEISEVLACVEEVERLVGRDDLDIEFAVDQAGTVFLLQVRPIVFARRLRGIPEERIRRRLARAAAMLPTWNAGHPKLVGRRRAWSVMADWNPAEMIGIDPAPLALSLYRSLVTDEAWATSRAMLGFRDVRPCPLMLDVVGKPYVDVRAGLNSFLPASLSDDLGARLVDDHIAKLEAHPELHDKLEFDVVPTCVTWDFEERADELRGAGFSATDVDALRAGLVETTRRTVERVGCDLEVLAALRRRCDRLLRSEARPLDRVAALLDDARCVGFPAFANLARAAFAATAMVRSLARAGVISGDQADTSLAALETVSGRMRRDGARVARGALSWGDFVWEYGHLRPGTYDIESPCYASDPSSYLRPFVRDVPVRVCAESSLPDAEHVEIARQLADVGWPRTEGGFGVFLRRSIEARELGKFTVSRNVSAALETLAAWGAEYGASRRDLSFLTVADLGMLRSLDGSDVAAHLHRVVDRRRARSTERAAAQLPALILSTEDLSCFERTPSEPNYITRRRVTAPPCAVRSDPARLAVEGKIVAIPAADPGFDWLFSRRPAGLVTMYGGANSHMAVRASEFGIPAAIGVGHDLFQQVSVAHLVELDCSSRRVRALC